MSPMLKRLLLIVMLSNVTMVMAQPDPMRILVYGDSNSWGWVPTSAGYPSKRLPDHQRWAGVLEQTLGTQAKVMVDGLVGRTSNLPSENAVGAVHGALFDGLSSLPASIASHAPLDWVIIMLGTNDVQDEHQITGQRIAKSVFNLAKLAKSMESPMYSTYSAPKVLVIAPPPLGDTSKTPLSGLFSVGEKLSADFSRHFTDESKKHPGIHFMDAGKYVRTDGVDGVHLSAQAHKVLGQVVAKLIAGE